MKLRRLTPEVKALLDSGKLLPDDAVVAAGLPPAMQMGYAQKCMRDFNVTPTTTGRPSSCLGKGNQKSG